jgi:hypothetical protein
VIISCKQEKGTALPSFVATHLEALAQEGTASEEDIEDIKGSAGAIYVGALLFLTCTCSLSVNLAISAGMETVSSFSVALYPF